MSKEASLVAKFKEPEPRTPEEEAEHLEAIDRAKRESEAIEGAGEDGLSQGTKGTGETKASRGSQWSRGD